MDKVQWEYKRVNTLNIDELAALGIEGWELVWVSPDRTSHYFKRPMDESSAEESDECPVECSCVPQWTIAQGIGWFWKHYSNCPHIGQGFKCKCPPGKVE